MKRLRSIFFVGFFSVAACKSTGVQPPMSSDAMDIRTDYYTVKTPLAISSSLQEELNTATGEPVCFGELFNDANRPTVGIYLCARAPQDITQGTGVFFELKGGQMLYFGAPVGEVSPISGTKTLVNLCNGTYENQCRLAFLPDGQGFAFEFTGTRDIKKFQFKVVRTFSPRGAVKKYLAQVDGHAVCVGELSHNLGKDLGLYLCDPQLGETRTAQQVVLLDRIGDPSPVNIQAVGQAGVPYGEIGPLDRPAVLNHPTFKLSNLLDAYPFPGNPAYDPNTLDVICRVLGYRNWDRRSAVGTSRQRYDGYFTVPKLDGGADLQFRRGTPVLEQITCETHGSVLGIPVGAMCHDRSQWPCSVHVRDGQLVVETHL